MIRHTTAAEAAPGFLNSVFKPLFISLAITALSLCLLAACIAFGPVTEKAADSCILISTACSMFLAGFLTARRRKGRGFISGSLAGLFYTAAAYLVQALGFGDFSFGSGFVKLLLLGIFLGALGGIFGVNTRRKTR